MRSKAMVGVGLVLLFGVWPFTTDSWIGPIAFVGGWVFAIGAMFVSDDPANPSS